MNKTRRRITAALSLTLLASFAVATGCGTARATDPTPVQTFKITPAANATPAPARDDATPSAVASVLAESPTPAQSGAILIAGVGNQFDIEEIQAVAGTITVEFDNRDGGVVHNIHFFKGGDADGESVAETEIETGPPKQTLTFDVQPGEYFYQCDAHPATMSGKLVVVEG